ncbi:DUF6804 family protein [Pedobacter endophyticus]|uniref:Uncharacterized protein n=1 Tax=Pedobacter endophyticus TaxID=2789740 RepID=A0A7U3Q3T7_9SPHI|nr:DUF6804 family protein [Pedobacter endophyticus]QPH37844.1 hypothetical protein IZT61_12055 [Pedobacter endophyticus]
MMKVLPIISAVACLIGIFNLPIEFYTFLRIIVSVTAVLFGFMLMKERRYLLMMLFACVLVVFNPIFPIYLYKKSFWIPLDLITAALFLLITFIRKKSKTQPQKTGEVEITQKRFTRDRIVSSKIVSR